MDAQPAKPGRSFASDNASGVHPRVMAALEAANEGHALAYGDDRWTERTVGLFRELLGGAAEVTLTWGGTGANVVGLQCLLAPWQAVLCAETAHINVDECGAPEHFTGCKLVDVPTEHGKLIPEQIEAALQGQGNQHHVQIRVVSISQPTELGTLYSHEELAALADSCHRNGLLLHVDGARIANAVAALGGGLRTNLVDTGVDVATFGGTKNGMMYGEAVLFLTSGLGAQAHFVRKQAAQLPSKMRYVAAQFEALLTDDLWIANAANANAMATLLADRIAPLSGVGLVRRPEVNGLFVALPPAAIDLLIEWSFFWVWDAAASEVRWMCSFDTSPEDIEVFGAGVETIVGAAAPQ